MRCEKSFTALAVSVTACVVNGDPSAPLAATLGFGVQRLRRITPTNTRERVSFHRILLVIQRLPHVIDLGILAPPSYYYMVQ